MRTWLPTGGSRMALSCIVHAVTAELSDGLVHVFQVQRKDHGLSLTSHTLHASVPGRVTFVRNNRMRDDNRSPAGNSGIRIMSFNIWNYNGNWPARARMIADVIEASGAGAWL